MFLVSLRALSLPSVSSVLMFRLVPSRESLRPVRILPLANVHKVPFDRRRRSHDRANQVRPSTLALAPLEISIRSAGRAFPRLQHVVIHADAHAAPGIAPFESRIDEY